ncbi:HlyD family efflux transporter periplasmic adaptor subunit [Algoriphagus sp. SE2]|uniref:HlyD family secretion protein n=1 Tax=Algoriphagus sp. SE2 TaxID=3141536 RepID=UPI0031CCDA54
MDKKLFPQSIIQNTLEVYDSRIRVSSHLVYWLFLGLIFLFSLAMPLIYVDVAVQARGTFQSSILRNNVFNTVTGRLDLWDLTDNKKVKKGDVLAVIRGEQVNLEIRGIEERLDLLSDFTIDLKKLLSLDSSLSEEILLLKTKFYQASFLEFQTEVNNQEVLLSKLKRDFQRTKRLFESKSIAFAEYDDVELQYSQAKSQLELFRKQQVTKWQQEINDFSFEKDRLSKELEVSIEQLDQYKIVAGTSGTLLNVLNLNVGDFVYPNQKLAEISPDTTLLAVTYLPPSDIAFIKKGQEVKFQVDAFNHNQWGIVTGKVYELADDLTLINEKEAGFLITCTLDKLFLELPSGQKGEIKKGMTFNSRYVIARRSLFHLLYDKVDDWLNPLVNSRS